MSVLGFKHLTNWVSLSQESLHVIFIPQKLVAQTGFELGSSGFWVICLREKPRIILQIHIGPDLGHFPLLWATVPLSFLSDPNKVWIQLHKPLQIRRRLFRMGVKKSSLFHKIMFRSIVENSFSHWSRVITSNKSERSWMGIVLEQKLPVAALIDNSM